MSAAAEPRAARGPGRPASDAPERIRAAALEVLKREGYAGLTTAKVAAASGQNKALISYYFGSKRGLVAEVARQVSETISSEVLAGLGTPRRARELVEGLADGVQRVFERDEGIQRVYFDLASQSVVDPGVGEILAEMKEGHRAILRGLLRGTRPAAARGRRRRHRRVPGRGAGGAVARAAGAWRDPGPGPSPSAVRRGGDGGDRPVAPGPCWI